MSFAKGDMTRRFELSQIISSLNLCAKRGGGVNFRGREEPRKNKTTNSGRPRYSMSARSLWLGRLSRDFRYSLVSMSGHKGNCGKVRVRMVLNAESGGGFSLLSKGGDSVKLSHQ